MQGYTFTVSMEDTTIVGDGTLIIVHAASSWGTAGSLLEVVRAGCGQRSTDTSDMLGVHLARKVTAFGTYTSATPTPHVIGGVASGIAGGTSGAAATAGVDASAEGAGAVTTVYPVPFNNLNGWEWIATPEERLILGPDQAVILKIDGTPADLTLWYAYLTFRQLG